MNLQAPQLIYLAMVFMALGLALAKHGEPRTGKINFFSSLFSGIMMLALLYWGGFFTK